MSDEKSKLVEDIEAVEAAIDKANEAPSELSPAHGSAYRVDCSEPLAHLTMRGTKNVEILVRVLLQKGASQIEIKRVAE